MTAVLIEIEPIGPAATDEIELVDDLDMFAAAAVPGCGDDNPYQ